MGEPVAGWQRLFRACSAPAGTVPLAPPSETLITQTVRIAHIARITRRTQTA